MLSDCGRRGPQLDRITLGGVPDPSALEHKPLIRWTSPILASFIALLALLHSLSAQTPARGWVTPLSPALYAGLVEPGALSQDTLELPRTYWKEGALVGGATLGTIALVVSLGACADTDSVQEDKRAGCVLGSTAVSALLGATLGALIGGQIRSGPSSSERAQPPPD